MVHLVLDAVFEISDVHIPEEVHGDVLVEGDRSVHEGGHSKIREEVVEQYDIVLVDSEAGCGEQFGIMS